VTSPLPRGQTGYIGWVRPADVLETLLAQAVDIDTTGINMPVSFGGRVLNPGPGTVRLEYRELYAKARTIAEGLPALRYLTTTNPPLIIAPSWVTWDGPARYVNDPVYADLGTDALEPILLDQIGMLHIENNPRVVTPERFEELFAQSVHASTIDVSQSQEKQIEQFVASSDPYIGILRGGAFVRVATNTELQQVLFAALIAAAERE
jgi:hypothetical protein